MREASYYYLASGLFVHSLCIVASFPVHGLFHFPPGMFVNRIGRTPATRRPFLYHRPFAHTNYYSYSFVPHIVPYWNNLPPTVVSTNSYYAFKSYIRVHTLY